MPDAEQTSHEVARGRTGGLFDAATALLRAGTRHRTGPTPLVTLRRAAVGRLLEGGLPTRKDPGWSLTPVDAITRVAFELARPLAVYAGLGTRLRERIPCLDGERRLVLVDGRPIPGGLLYMAGDVEVRSLAQAMGSSSADVADRLGRCADLRRGFVALNTALFDDGLFVRIPRGAVVDVPIHVVVIAAAAGMPTMSHPRILVVAEAGSTATFVETYVGLPTGDAPTFTNAVTEVVLEKGAALQHVRIQDEGLGSDHLATLAVGQAEGSRYRAREISLGSAISRLDLDVLVDGSAAECALDGLWLAAGHQHLDRHLLVDLLRPGGTSLVRYRGVAADSARAVLAGRIVARADAVGGSARLENRNLLLSRDARVATRPSLEVEGENDAFAVSRLEEETLSWAASSQADVAASRAERVEQFLDDFLDRLPWEPLRRHVAREVLGRTT